jgi:hypothetical protein
MTDRRSESVGGMIRSRNLLHAEENTQQILNLTLLRLPLPDDCLFDLARSILTYNNTGLLQR